MALGDYSNPNQSSDNNGGTSFSPRTFSPISFKNPDSKVASSLTVSYWKGLICFTIAPKKPRKNGEEFDSYDSDASVSIYLNAGKARIFKKEIELLRNNRKAFSSVAVCNGKGNSEIILLDGEDIGIDGYGLVIRNIDTNGNEISSLGYEFNNSKTMYFSIRNVNLKSTDMDMNYHQDVELDIFEDILEEYYKSASYAVAASVHDGCWYTLNNIQNDIGLLLDHNGISNGRRKRSNNSGNANNSFFNRAAANNANNASMNEERGSSRTTRNMSLEEFEEGVN